MKIIETNWDWQQELSNRASTYRIILHHAAATCTAKQVHAWHKARGWAGIGYHFFINKDGEVYRGRPIDKMGAHAGGYNNDSIGICCEGNFEIETMQSAQKEAARQLVKLVREQYPSIKLVQKHSDVNATACPGKNYPFDYIAYGETDTDTDTDATPVYGICLPMLARGAMGEDTLILQKMLIGSGYSCGRYGTDGQFGASTEQSVKDFQTDSGILVDGIVGKQTWQYLFGKENERDG